MPEHQSWRGMYASNVKRPRREQRLDSTGIEHQEQATHTAAVN